MNHDKHEKREMHENHERHESHESHQKRKQAANSPFSMRIASPLDAETEQVRAGLLINAA
jgi:hypothetical protein